VLAREHRYEKPACIRSFPAALASTVVTVRAHVEEASRGRALVLDLAEVTFVDSSMLKELLRANVELERYDTRLVLAGITPVVRRVLDLTRTTGMFTLAGDRSAAVALASTDGR